MNPFLGEKITCAPTRSPYRAPLYVASGAMLGTSLGAVIARTNGAMIGGILGAVAAAFLQNEIVESGELITL